MSYALQIALRYLRAKRKRSVTLISLIAIFGVTLGVAALLTVLAVTTGFEQVFRDRVLGVNAHVLVLKYGSDFHDYKNVERDVTHDPRVAGAGPFVITEMMLAKGNRLSGVLVKGVDPRGVESVLDLPRQIIEGSVESLRVAGAKPPFDRATTPDQGDPWAWLREIKAREDRTSVPSVPPSSPAASPSQKAPSSPASKKRALPKVASPSEVQSALANLPALDADWNVDAKVLAQGLRSLAPVQGAALPSIIIGSALARENEIQVGDAVTLMSPVVAAGLSGIGVSDVAARSSRFRVVAVFDAGFYEYDSRLVYTDVYEAQRILGQGDNVTGIEIKLHDLDQSLAFARELEASLDGTYHTLDWSELNKNLFTALSLQKIVLTLVIATIIFVAAFNVIATLIMMVLEKRREVGMLKAMGASNLMVLLIFVAQGFVIGALGTFLGIVLGVGVIRYLAQVRLPLDAKVYLIDHIPVAADPSVVVIAAFVALLICALATLPPSLWASKMLPVDALRRG